MINVDLFNYINHNLQNPFFDFIMPIITHLGGFKILIVACVLVFVLSIIYKNDNVKRIVLLCALSLLIAGGIAVLLKNAVLEPRPFVSLSNVHLLIAEDDPNSFPSGHTTSTFAVISVLMFKLRNKLWAVVLLFWGILIGFSRIYVGVHYPLDVLAGAIIGIVIAYLVYRYEDKIYDLWNRIINFVL